MNQPRTTSKSPTPDASPTLPTATTPTTAPATSSPEPLLPPIRRRRPYRQDTHSPQVKVEAILALWTERRSRATICRELAINWNQLNAWQDRALEAMLQALQPRQATEPAPLTRPLEQLFARKGLKAKTALNPKLQQRLQQIQAKEA